MLESTRHCLLLLGASTSRTGNRAVINADNARIRLGRALLASVMIGLGIRGFMTGEFASVWQRIPLEYLPFRQFFVYAVAAIELATGVGLLFRRTLAISSAVLLVFMLLWAALLKLPAVITAPWVEENWLGFGEIGVMAAGAWVVFADSTGTRAGSHAAFASGARGVRYARLLFALSLPMIGLSHFFYAKETVSFIPAWLPWHLAWAYLTGAGNIVACLCILFSFWPRLAATTEAAMLSVITLVVWMPGLVTDPSNNSWTTFLMSSAIACGAWAVADSFRRLQWFAILHGRNGNPADIGSFPDLT